MTDSQRIKQVLNYCGLSARKLASELGLKSPQIFYDIKAEKCGISKELAIKIQKQFLNVSAAWLLTGEGEMLRTTSTNVGEVSGDCNTLGMTVSQSIGENSGQNAGRDINNYCAKQFLHELAEMRKLMERQLNVYTSSLEKEKEQIKAANAQIETLIRNNQEQFNRLLALLESK